MSEKNEQRNPYHSFFWPVIMLGAGVIWLLVNLNIISTYNLRVLYRLWPILIILAGLDVLFSRKLPLLGALLALLMIAGVILLLVLGSPFVTRIMSGLQVETFISGIGITYSLT